MSYRPKYYKLSGGAIVPTNEHSISTVVRSTRGQYTVSTVFLGISFNDSEPLFETIVFKNFDFENCTSVDEGERQSTYDDSLKYHIQMCRKWFGSYADNEIFIDML